MRVDCLWVCNGMTGKVVWQDGADCRHELTVGVFDGMTANAMVGWG